MGVIETEGGYDRRKVGEAEGRWARPKRIGGERWVRSTWKSDVVEGRWVRPERVGGERWAGLREGGWVKGRWVGPKEGCVLKMLDM